MQNRLIGREIAGEGAVQLSREELLKAYRDMVTIRRFEERVQEEF